MQLSRLKQRGISEEDARRRIAAQWPTERKAALADYVIRTDGSFDETERQVEQLFSRLARDARER
jgi:dephospho-CoA kinase